MLVNRLLYVGIASLFILLISSGSSLSRESPVTVNIMIDVNADPMSDPGSGNALGISVINLTNGIDVKRLNGTLYLTGDSVMQMRLLLASIGNSSNHELAMGGMSLGERLSTISYTSQKSLLEEVKRRVVSCRICGEEISINGFKPQGLDQNDDTYKVLRSLGVTYDTGFSDGVKYQPGHENDSWPYPTEIEGLYAVPISTHNVSGERVYLSDRAVAEKGLDGSQWYDLLVNEFDESEENGDPVVVAFDNLISGTRPDYLDAYLKFIDYASNRDANFITTMDLVNMSRSTDPEYYSGSKGDSSSNSASSGCSECDKAKGGDPGSAQDTTPKIISVSIKPNDESAIFNDKGK